MYYEDEAIIFITTACYLLRKYESQSTHQNGYVDYYLHNGVDLTEKSTNTKPGDPVYSVYSDGEVIASTYDDTYPDKKVIGGWIKIRYLMTIDKNNYDFTITYGNIDKSSLKLKTGDKVDKKQEIGKVGTSADTEFGK
jgi:murein DD-endopeptidase MepM/ murein hydrolase activator NlpD